MVLFPVVCTRCGHYENVVKNGFSAAGAQRFRCGDCEKVFQLTYSNNACKPGIKEQIARMAINGSGSRDIARVLGISTSTVSSVLRSLVGDINAGPQRHDHKIILLMIDEQWCFVGKKGNPHWLFSAFDMQRRHVVAHATGPRNPATLRVLIERIKDYRIEMVITDDWPPYRQHLQTYDHYVCKKYMQILERHNLNVRTHLKRFARKTVCFSRQKDIHDRVVDHYMFVNHYQHY